MDNQCPGDSGYGRIDEAFEVTGMTFGHFDSRDIACWDPLDVVAPYEFSWASDPTFESDCGTLFTAGALCVDTRSLDPAPIVFFLVHALGNPSGPYGWDSSGAARAVSCSMLPPPG